MTIYITWSKSIDSDFRAFYPSVSDAGETIQTQPAENETHFMVGTTRLNSTGQAALTAEFGESVMFSETLPQAFETSAA